MISNSKLAPDSSSPPQEPALAACHACGERLPVSTLVSTPGPILFNGEFIDSLSGPLELCSVCVERSK